ncbi:ACP S-malonyltransferase [Demequina sp. SYSU T00039]|uniref:[acyl-carrier-protein] S-malonyltransferase n=1 Tax=Demequina lignilytica TaxID=3051663 RepID=A0AAW7M800_9MICO|nr:MULTISPECIES: ACP S-malonyltransferase [unclassified Demequina]MDN4478522.1 ACP S-malonyltransferase [Demequina sp. SYSU T00039-1]MDN4486971.1 ACP S-malonyltransferase [Demequina sp. SYSU T00039]
MIAVLCPGQGAQAPGMLAPWLELPSVAARLGELAEASGVDIVRHGTSSDADTIRDTAIAQPLLVATAIATGRELLGGAIPALTAGHSVGELGAAALAGALTDADAMRLVTVRANAMAEAAASSEPTSMAAVLGGVEEDVAAALAEHGLTPANVNGGGQVVAAGSKAAIEALVAAPPARARVIELQVAGAFHTTYMAPAVAALDAAAGVTTPADPAAILLSNADGAQVADGADALARIVRQVANPVRWDLCMRTMLELGVTGIVEVAPGGVLTGLAKRAMKGVPAVALKTPDDLAAARELLEA